MNLDKVNKYIKDFEKTITKPKTNFDKSKFYVGVDLGTANIVIIFSFIFILKKYYLNKQNLSIIFLI